MSTTSFALFDTPLGTAGVAWSDRGVSGVHLPEPDAVRVRRVLRRRFPEAHETVPTPEIRDAIEHMGALLSGEAADLSGVVLDMQDIPPFDRAVYDHTRTIPPGQTETYGQIARWLGDVHLARDVGQALGRNPFPIVVPCHRVIAANGKLGGFSARGGLSTKQRLLSIERARVSWQLPLEMPLA
jgi:methylated-DNA-[protein]-cysteine S-methyltransferase